MNGSINLLQVYISDFAGFLLTFGIFFSTIWMMQKTNEEDTYIVKMLLVVAFSCLADVCSFALDGKSGNLFRILSFIANSWLFLSNMVIMPLGVKLISFHINGSVSKFQTWFIRILCAMGYIILAANIFYPLVFKLDQNNVYSRCTFYWFFNFIEWIFMVDTFVIYFRGKAKGGVLKFFPVFHFFIPVATGILIQTLFYGISTIWLGLSIGIDCMIIALLNENIVKDKLTNLYNRYYLDKLKASLKKETSFGLLMLDINGFKKINDEYGHSEGDKALVTLAELLKSFVACRGTAIRYAGDEFVIILNAKTEEEVSNFAASLKSNIRVYNKNHKDKYGLSVAAGYGLFNLKESQMDDILKIVDERMYKDKNCFYRQLS